MTRTPQCPTRGPVRGSITVSGLTALLVAGQVFTAAPAAAWELRVCADADYMPLSNDAGEGYDNRIVEILAEEMGAELTWQWWALSPTMINQQLREGNCDMMVGVPDGGDGVIATIAYYRSPYAFVYRADAGYDIATFDDAILTDLQLGTTSAGASSHLALARRGMLDSITVTAETTGSNTGERFSSLIESVASGDIDVAVPWGPVAGYYAARQDPPLKMVPAPEFDIPFTPMYHSMVFAMRMGDEQLRDLLDRAIAARWDDIYAVLDEYNIPTLPLPRPTLSIREQQ